MNRSAASETSLLIRADASLDIGTGHVMRCLALAQAWHERGGDTYIRGQFTEGLRDRLAKEEVETIDVGGSCGMAADATVTAQRAKEVGACWVVVDGYRFGADYQHRLREEGCRVLFIDDYGHADQYEADLVLNQNIDAETSLYETRGKYTDLLLGPKFVLLRKEFWPWRAPRRPLRQESSRILVTLGGADPDNMTTRAVRALAQIETEGVSVIVVVGGSNTHEESIRTAAERADVPMEVRQDVEDMASLMAKCDVAVSAGGSTCWELAFMGLPNVIIELAQNQQGIADGLDDVETAIDLGWHEAVDEKVLADTVESLLRKDDHRLQMARRAQALVDGKGTRRVLQKMGSLGEHASSTSEHTPNRR